MNDLGVFDLLGARGVGRAAPGVLASSGITTVSPLPVIPLLSSGVTP
jgi:hypothetical protein